MGKKKGLKGKASDLTGFYKSEEPKARRAQVTGYKTHDLVKSKGLMKKK